jgi:hypothetical protein
VDQEYRLIADKSNNKITVGIRSALGRLEMDKVDYLLGQYGLDQKLSIKKKSGNF